MFGVGRFGCLSIGRMIAKMKIKMTPRQFLTAMDVAPNGQNYDRLSESLERLSQFSTAKLPPAVKSWKKLPDGQLEIEVDEAWVPPVDAANDPNYTRVALPLPTKTFASNFYLVMHTLDLAEPCKLNLHNLCNKIGISTSRRDKACRALVRAVTGVNKHLTMKLRREELSNEGIWYPQSIAPEVHGYEVTITV